ncbi:MAG: hypothetical protein ACRC6T_10975 [Sarcina sp.]
MRKCCRCNIAMTEKCRIDNIGKIRLIKEEDISQTVTSYVDAAVCPSCGKVELYVENSTNFV